MRKGKKYFNTRAIRNGSLTAGMIILMAAFVAPSSSEVMQSLLTHLLGSGFLLLSLGFHFILFVENKQD